MPKTLTTTKHFQLAQKLRSEIKQMKIGDPLPTVMDLRQTHCVSQATVDRALERLRREGLIVRPAGQLRPVVAAESDPAVHRVAIIRPDYPSPTFEELTRVIVDAGKANDWAFDLVYYRHLEHVNIRQDVGDNDAGILLPTTEPFPETLIQSLKRPQRPVIVIQDPPEGLRVSSVRIDDEQIGRMAVEHLASLGHKRILLVLSEPLAPSGEQRAIGWRKQMLAIGQENLEELVVDCQTHPFDNSILGSYEYFRKWLATPHPKFTAIFCACFTGAVSVLRALRESKLRVPDDVSVISHGGEGYMAPFLFPALTAVETNLVDYGQLVVEQLHHQLNDSHPVQKHLTVPSKLVVRETTGKLRK